MTKPTRPLREYRTFGKSRAVRLPEYDYAQDVPTHLTICADGPICTQSVELAQGICEDVTFYCGRLAFRLFGYCLMPDHIHVLLSSGESGVSVGEWLRLFKSHTTSRYLKKGYRPPLWQRSAFDHVCRDGETVETVLAYIVNNPVRRRLVGDWKEWPWTRILVEI